MLLSFNLVEYVTGVHTIVYAMAAGIAVAALLAVYYRCLLGRFIRYLLAQKIFTPQDAVPFADTPMGRNIFIKGALSSGGAYSNVLYYTDGVECKSVRPSGKRPDKATLQKRKYYIPDELKYRAEYMFRKKGNDLFMLIFTVIGVVALAVFCIFVIPELMTMLDNYINEFGG